MPAKDLPRLMHDGEVADTMKDGIPHVPAATNSLSTDGSPPGHPFEPIQAPSEPIPGNPVTWP